MGVIRIVNEDITKVKADAIVNAANEGLKRGGGVCGAIFEAAGIEELTIACDAIGHCAVGEAVITPAFGLENSRYIIHAVGPKYEVGLKNEDALLRLAYRNAIFAAERYGCRSIAFPLISAGAFGYPPIRAWKIALKECASFVIKGSNDMEIIFVCRDAEMCELGMNVMASMRKNEEDRVKRRKEAEKNKPGCTFFWKTDGKHGCFSNWYIAPFTVEGIRYLCVEQYMMAKKALMFADTDIYMRIMLSSDPAEMKTLGRQVRNFNSETWASARCEVVNHGCYAKFVQNPLLKLELLSTGNDILAEASPEDKIWGIGMGVNEAIELRPYEWNGENLLGRILMNVRRQLQKQGV